MARPGVTASWSREREIEAIDEFVELRGVTWYEPHYGCETSVHLPAGIVAARLAAMETRPPLEYARLLHQLLTAWRR
jgi:hypothetical protein